MPPAPAAGRSPAGPVLPSIDRYFDGKWPYAGPSGPSITWIPGDDAWLEWRQDADPATAPGADSEILVRVEAETGSAATLTSVPALSAALGEFEPGTDGVRGIGRRPVPRLTVAPDGAAVVVRHRGVLFRVDLRRARPPLPLNVSQVFAEGRALDWASVSDVRVAAGGREVSYVRDHDLWFATVEGEDALVASEIRVTKGGSDVRPNAELDWVYPEELDASTAAWWSPDGSRIAYLSLDQTGVPRFPIVDPTPIHGTLGDQTYPYVGDRNPAVSFHVARPTAASPSRSTSASPRRRSRTRRGPRGLPTPRASSSRFSIARRPGSSSAPAIPRRGAGRRSGASEATRGWTSRLPRARSRRETRSS